jgi:sugar lactone lactonase YvrE
MKVAMAAVASTVMLVACGGGAGESTPEVGTSNSPDAPAALQMTRSAGLSLQIGALAGSMGGPGNVDGNGALARFDAPGGIAAGPDGRFLVADKNNKAIRQIDSRGKVTTLVRNPNGAGTEPFALPDGVVYDGIATQRTYVSDRQKHVIYRIEPSGELRVLAGQSWVNGFRDGVGSDARFSTPLAMTLGPGNTLFVADRDNHAVRVVDAAGGVATLAGQGIEGPAVEDVQASEARFNHPVGVAYAPLLRHEGASVGDYRVYIADTRNHVIRYYSSHDGRVRILAGKNGAVGGADGTGDAARFARPEGLAVSPRGDYLAVADTGNHAVRLIYIGPGERFGRVDTLAGGAGLAGDEDGAALAARFQQPASLAFDGTGDLLVTDFASSTVRKISSRPGLQVSTLAGSPALVGSTDGDGTAARFRNPSNVLLLDDGRAIVADTGNHLIRVVEDDGRVTRMAGSGQAGAVDGNALDARFNQPRGMAQAGGNLYVADMGNASLRALTAATGQVSTVAGLAGQTGNSDGQLNESRLNKPAGLAAAAGDARVYVSDLANHNIRVFDIGTGRLSTVAGFAGTGTPSAGNTDGPGALARFNQPAVLAAASPDLLYVLDAGNRALRRLSRQADGDWQVSTLLTNLDITTGSALAVDAMGVIHVSDTKFTVRRYAPDGQALGVVLGTAGQRGFVPGEAPGVIEGARGLAVGGGRLVFTHAQGLAQLSDLGPVPGAGRH